MKMPGNVFGNELKRVSAVAVIFLLFCVVVNGQPGRAETVFSEAKALAATEAIETLQKAFAKFDEAAGLFRSGGNTVKVAEVELEHGRVLHGVAIRELKAKRYVEAQSYFDRALTKFRAADNPLETAYVYHNLGFMSDQRGLPEDAAKFYNSALEAYRAAGDHSGEATVLRNLGLIRLNEKKATDALALFASALKIRNEQGDRLSGGLLRVDMGDAYQANQRTAEALVAYDEALKLYRQAADRKGEATVLYKIGAIQSALFKYSEAIANLEAALKIYEQEKLYGAEAETADLLGGVQMSNGKYLEAERYLNRAADMYMILKDGNSEGSTALNIAINYQSMSRIEEARTAIERALTRFRETKNALGEAYAQLIYADILSFLNQHDEALAKIEAAQKIFKEHDNTNADYRVARAFSNHYYALSNHGEAIRYGLIALAAAEREKDEFRKASISVDIANSYSALGQKEKSIEYTSKSLSIARQVGSRYMESVALSNLGYDYLRLDKLTEAQDHFQKAIALMKADGFEREEGYATHNLGLLYYKRRQYPLALSNYDRALSLYRKTGDRRPEAFVYDSYGELYRDLGQYDKAIEFLEKAVVLAREIRYSEIEAQALGNMMTLWTGRRQPRLAILYGKQAVNVYQAIRAGTRTLDKAAQKSFVQSNEKTYRQLANLMIDAGRLAEAQQVLDLLKAEEYFEFVRRDAAEAGAQGALALNDSERKALEEYARVSATLTELGVKFQTLQDERNRAGGKLDAAKESEYVRLKKQVEDAGEGLKTFFLKLASEFSKKVEDGTVVTPQSIETLKADLRRAGPDVVLVSTYLLPERYRAIVTTGRTMVDRKVEYSLLKLTGADINRKIFEFQRALQNPSVDPRKLGKELYDIFVKPLENDLRASGAKTILWSLDGSLRYIPLAALSPDGRTYFAERYQNVVVTLGRQTNLFAKPGADEWRAIGAGVSKQHAGFSALPSVPAEIGSIVRGERQTTGVLGGVRMLDEQFNLESLRNTVPQQTEDGKPFNVLHLATHFSLGANDQDSALLLGDGSRLSLFEIGRDEALDFKDLELLTLSACQTGVATGDANGREVESLGMLAQKKGAKAVLATLWKVADESTSLFMAEFYRIKKANPTMNKAEAVRLAQKEMIDGKIKSSGTSSGCRAETFAGGPKPNEFKCDPNAPFSHPYFWSPFVLIGNWR